MESTIERVVERLFPETLVSFDSFSEWCALIREEAQPAAADLVARLENRLENARPDCAAKCRGRASCYEWFGGEVYRLIKSSSSVRSKLARDRIDKPVSVPRLTEEELRRSILDFSDLGRVRLVADFPDDVQCLLNLMLKDSTFLAEYHCPGGVKDFVYDRRKRDGLKGHRAIQFSVRVPLSTGHDFGFEVQLMTRLQHAWDRRNHPFYEWQREHPNWEDDLDAMRLAVNDFACAESLHLIDQQAEQNRMELKRLLGRERTE